MDVLKIQNVNSVFFTTNQEIRDGLHQGMRFRDPGAFYSPAYQNKKWDGYKNFYNPKTGMFLTGLVPEVVKFLTGRKHPFRIEDQRVTAVKWIHTEIDENFLKPWQPKGTPEITLHDFQPDLVNMAIKHQRGLIVAPTGAGKTFCLISLLKSMAPKTPTLFLTKSSDLVRQNYDEMIQWGIEGVGRWSGSHKEPNHIMCVVLHHDNLKAIKSLLPKFKALIVDEVHDCVADSALDAYRQMINATVRIGISATAFRKKTATKENDIHKFTVKGHFGPVLKTSTTASGVLTTKELQKRGILSKSKCIFYVIDYPDIRYEPWQDALTLGVAENYYFHDIVRRLWKSLPGRTLTMVERVVQGYYLKQIMPEASWIYGTSKTKVRKDVYTALSKEGDASAIVMRHIITAGINVKVHNLINASSGNAPHNVVQQIGRGLRLANDKEVLQYRDFYFTNNDYLEEHSELRVKVLRQEGHDVEVKKIDF